MLLPIGDHDVALLLKKFEHVGKIPIGINDVGLHVCLPLIGQAPYKNPFLLSGSDQHLLEAPEGFPLLQEGFPIEALSIPSWGANQGVAQLSGCSLVGSW